MVSSFEPRWVEKDPAFRLQRAGPCTQSFMIAEVWGSAAKQFGRGHWFQKEKAPPDDGAKDVMHGATQGSLNPSPTRSHSRANTSKLGRGIALSGMTRFAQIAVVPSPGRLPSALTSCRDAYAIRALPDLCRGIVSGRLEAHSL
jgi:hypothetical protein